MKNIGCGKSESVSEKKKREILKEIVKGKEAAIQLQLLLEKPYGSEPSFSYHQLMANVLTSFTHSLSIINSSSSSKPTSADGRPPRPVTASGIDPTSGHCSGKRAQKVGRGRYNRRLTCTFSLICCFS